MPEISVILPSIRLEEVLQRIKEFSITNQDSDYEIIVVSPFPVKGDKVVHIAEEPLGCIHAHNTAYKNSSGKYIAYWGDRASPTTNCLSNMLNFVKSNTDPFIGSFRFKDSRGGRERRQWTVYGKLYAAFGCASRNTINIIGGYFDPIFKAYWVDPDMCLRTWEHGGKVEICPNAWLEVNTFADQIAINNWGKYFDADKEAFFNRWHDKLGKGIRRDFHSVNKPLIITQRIDSFPLFMRPALTRLYSTKMEHPHPLKELQGKLYSWLAYIPYLRKIKRSLAKRLLHKRIQ